MDTSTIGGWVSVIIGLAVSLDVVALTFCSPNIVFSSFKRRFAWAVLNGLWHAGLLLMYLVLIDVAAVLIQFLGFLLNLQFPDFLNFLQPGFEWLSERFRSHVILYAATAGMAFVWYQYTTKIVSVPTDPQFQEVPRYLRWIFRLLRWLVHLIPTKLRPANEDRFITLNLAACLVAVDMLALAAVIKSGEKALQFPEGLSRTETSWDIVWSKIVISMDYDFIFRTIEVTALTLLIVSVLCYASTRIARTFWSRINADGSAEHETSTIIVMAMKVLEPLVIFYFIIHGTAFIATGIPIHNPAFVLGSALLVAALLQYVGFANVVRSAREQAATGALSGQ